MRLFPPPVEGVALSALLERCDADAGDAERPPEGSFVTAFRRRRDACVQAARLELIPIVAVCGTVNSGKSSAVAGFLSPAGSARVLVGELDAEGTHRFVFWLPASWRGHGTGGLLEEMIRSATGCEPEELSDDPAEAARQYNAAHDRAHAFNIPLIAYDARLDATGVAFLDCPDTQRPLDEHADGFTARLRLARLKSIAPLCSAFVVVASMQQKGGEELGKVFAALNEAASEAPLYFVLNMTRGDDAAVYLPEARHALDRWGVTPRVRRIYVSPFIHSDDPRAKVVPAIASMDGERTRLENLAAELDPAELQQRHRASCENLLRALLDDVARRVREADAADGRTVAGTRERIRLFMARTMIDEDGRPRALEFNEAAKSIAASIQRTAPLAIRLANAPAHWLRGMTAKWRRLDAAEADPDAYARIKSTDFSAFLSGSRCIPPDTTAAALDAVWQQALEAVIRHSRSHTLDARELDEATRRMWADVPFRRKAALFLNVGIAMSVIAFAGMLMPFDGGASIIIVAKAHMVLGGAEILGMLVGGSLIGALMSIDGARRLIATFERECARPQLDALHAALADGLGIPRGTEDAPALEWRGEVCHEFRGTDLPELPCRIDPLRHPWIRLDESAWAAMIAPPAAAMP